MANQEQGSFLAGFSVGLVAGAAGYFLFGTDRGRDVKERLAAEWEEARKSLPSQGNTLLNYSSVSELIRSVGNMILDAESEGREKATAQRASKEKKAGVKKAKPKFKGL